MATWNEDAPALANAISADVPDIKENLEFLALFARERRSIFTYNGGTTPYTIKCKSAYYYCKDKVCWWDAELTTTAIGSPVKDDWYYLYLDNSAITSGTEITNSELLWSATEPAWSATYAGWYNGDDKCIFAALTNSTPTNILEFFHDGDLVIFADQITSINSSPDCDTWTDATLSIPKFTQKAEIAIRGSYTDTDTDISWRTNGQTGTTGHIVGFVGDTISVGRDVATLSVITDSSQKIEVQFGAATGNVMDVYTQGWYFPVGL